MIRRQIVGRFQQMSAKYKAPHISPDGEFFIAEFVADGKHIVSLKLNQAEKIFLVDNGGKSNEVSQKKQQRALLKEAKKSKQAHDEVAKRSPQSKP